MSRRRGAPRNHAGPQGLIGRVSSECSGSTSLRPDGSLASWMQEIQSVCGRNRQRTFPPPLPNQPGGDIKSEPVAKGKIQICQRKKVGGGRSRCCGGRQALPLSTDLRGRSSGNGQIVPNALPILVERHRGNNLSSKGEFTKHIIPPVRSHRAEQRESIRAAAPLLTYSATSNRQRRESGGAMRACLPLGVLRPCLVRVPGELI